MARQPEYNQNLIGITELADILGLSRQRADQLSRTADFPEPVRLVLPIDELTLDMMLALEEADDFPGGSAAACYNAVAAHGFTLPAQPRIWRYSMIQRWAEDHGRSINEP